MRATANSAFFFGVFQTVEAKGVATRQIARVIKNIQADRTLQTSGRTRGGRGRSRGTGGGRGCSHGTGGGVARLQKNGKGTKERNYSKEMRERRRINNKSIINRNKKNEKMK